MQILAQFPIRERERSFFATLGAYMRLAERPEDIEYHVVFDSDDPVFTRQDTIAKLMRIPLLGFSIQTAPATKIAACNYGVGGKVFDIVLLISDDMVPVVEGWDEIIRREMRAHAPDTDGVLWFNDGYQGRKLNTLCILGRAYYDRFGYIYHPEYQSLYCDNEFMMVADSLGRQTYHEDVIIEHRHPDTGNRPSDAVYGRNGRLQWADQQLFEKRKAAGFPLREAGAHRLQ